MFAGVGLLAPDRLARRHMVERARTGAHGPMVSAGGSPLGEGLPTLDRLVCWERVSAQVGEIDRRRRTMASALSTCVDDVNAHRSHHHHGRLSAPALSTVSAARQRRPHGLTHVSDRQDLHSGDLAQFGGAGQRHDRPVEAEP